MFAVKETIREATKICVSVFDDETCLVCATWHGVAFEADDDVIVLPNRHCTCPHGCRCRWVWSDANAQLRA